MHLLVGEREGLDLDIGGLGAGEIVGLVANAPGRIGVGILVGLGALEEIDVYLTRHPKLTLIEPVLDKPVTHGTGESEAIHA